MKRDITAVVVGTLYLFLYCGLLQFESTKNYAVIMLLFSPFLIIWMVLTVLIHGKYDGPSLGKDEFGYQDKKKDELGIF